MVEDRIAASLPPELAAYVAETRQAVRLEGSFRLDGTATAVVDANMCDAAGGDAAPAGCARALCGLDSAAAAQRLASALAGWRVAGVPEALAQLGQSRTVLGIPAGWDGIEQGRCSLGELMRFSTRCAPLGARGTAALAELWERGLQQAGVATQGVSVAGALAAARALGRKPMRARFELSQLSAGLNAHKALRMLSEVQRRRGGTSAAAAAAFDLLAAQNKASLDLVAANLRSFSLSGCASLRGGEANLVASDVAWEGPLGLAAPLPGIQSGVVDLRRTHEHREHPPLPAVLRVTVEQAPASATVAEHHAQAAAGTAADAVEGMLVVELLCPPAMLAPFGAPQQPDATEQESGGSPGQVSGNDGGGDGDALKGQAEVRLLEVLLKSLTLNQKY